MGMPYNKSNKIVADRLRLVADIDTAAASRLKRLSSMCRPATKPRCWAATVVWQRESRSLSASERSLLSVLQRLRGLKSAAALSMTWCALTPSFLAVPSTHLTLPTIHSV